MAFLTLNGLTVHVQSDNAGQDYDEHGVDRERMFDGTMRQTRRGIYRKWQATTKLLDNTDYLALVALLKSNALPLTANGDLVGNEEVGVIPVIRSASPKHTAAGFRRRVVFELYEAGGVAAPDTSAAVWTFWRGGRDLFFDDGMTTPAATADDVAVWADQSGNDRHGRMTNGINFGESPVLRPTRDGNLVLFGRGSSDTTALGLIGYGFHLLTEAELMVTLRADADPPLSGETLHSLLHNLGGAGASKFPSVDGHIYETFGVASAQDLGDLLTDLTELLVYSVSAGPGGLVARINNEVVFENPSATIDFGSGATGFYVGGLFPNVGSGWFGAMQHFLITQSVMTDAQRRSWFDFQRGAVENPPLAP